MRYCRELDDNQIQYYQIIPTLEKSNELKVYGKNVTKLQKEFSDAVKQYGYTVVTKDLELSPSDRPQTSDWIELAGGVQPSGSCTLTINGKKVSTINAIMQAYDTRRQRPKKEYFGVTTAHSFLSEAENHQLEASTRDYEEVLKNVFIRSLCNGAYMSVRGGKPVDITSHPLPLYKYWVREGTTGICSALQDIALFKLDDEQVYTESLVDALYVENNNQPLGLEAFIVDINSEDELKKYEGRNIYCAEKKGYLISSLPLKDSGFVLGTHLTFVLENYEK